MDYEWRIQIAEKELAHLREMQTLAHAHQDTTDQNVHILGNRMDRVEADLAETAANLKEASNLAKVTQQKLTELINALHGGQRNGHE